MSTWTCPKILQHIPPPPSPQRARMLNTCVQNILIDFSFIYQILSQTTLTYMPDTLSISSVLPELAKGSRGLQPYSNSLRVSYCHQKSPFTCMLNPSTLTAHSYHLKQKFQSNHYIFLSHVPVLYDISENQHYINFCF